MEDALAGIATNSNWVAIGPDDRLIEDLELDSLGLAVAFAFIEELLPAGDTLQLDEVPDIITCRELYDFYVETAQAQVTKNRAGSDTRNGITLRRLEQHHLSRLHSIVTDPAVWWRWRYDDPVPTPEEFAIGLDAAGILERHVVTRVGRTTPLGLVLCYNPDWVNRHAWIAVAMQRDLITTGMGIAALYLLGKHILGKYDFTKLYAESIAPNFATYASGRGQLYALEARLKDHALANGTIHDLVIIGLTRQHLGRTDEDNQLTAPSPLLLADR
ncbi:MAG TPA: hypothetical protein VHB02_15320 [Acidimicrobiales bacterium]|nr:hypothetical protein [Acidimicrobiales bacterium]